ncbi:MAG: PAS domain S-box protein, partial [Verrucomicrobiaceae bacterium]
MTRGDFLYPRHEPYSRLDRTTGIPLTTARILLADSEVRFHTLFDAAPVAIGIIRKGVLLYANPALALLMGVPEPAQLVGEQARNFIVPSLRDDITNHARTRIRRGVYTPSVPYETVVQRVDGTRVPVRTEIAPISLADGNAVIKTTYLVNGLCSFTAPSDNFVPTLTLVAAFSGVTASGDAQVAGGGIGTFEVEKPAGGTYTYLMPTPLSFLGKTEATATSFVFNRTAARGGDTMARMMATFHGVADMVREMKLTIGVDKAGGFKVLFPQAGNTSFFDGTRLNITTVRAYVWDVIGHEFGHMVQNDTSSINAQGGAHNGSNQYDHAPNASTFQNKLKSNRLALNEGYGTWIGIALTRQSSRYKGKMKWIGDLRYRDFNPIKPPDAGDARGEDTEIGVGSLLWCLHDEIPATLPVSGLKDETDLGLATMFSRFKGKKMDSTYDVWRHLFAPGSDTKNFEKASGIDSTALRKAMQAANL